MTTYYVNSGAGGSNTGADWTNAYTAFGSAVTAATTDDDIIKVHVGHAEALAVDTTYTFAANVRVICVDKDSSDALATMDGTTQYIGNTSTNRAITFAGTRNVYFYGMAFVITGSDQLTLNLSDGSRTFEECKLLAGGAGHLIIGGAGAQAWIRVIGGTVRVPASATTAYTQLGSVSEFIGVTFTFGATVPTGGMFRCTTTDAAGAVCVMIGCDLSGLGNNIILGDCTASPTKLTLISCKLASSFIPLGSQTLTGNGGGEITLLNSYSGDEHIHMQHHNVLGSTICDTGIYTTDNICDSNLSWKIVGTSNATLYLPYQSPWIDVYHTGTSAITPSLECVRSGSATAYNNDTLWSEWSYQGTSGYPLAVFVTSDRMTPLGSAAAQTTGALGAGDWTGENATSWFGKLAPAASFTPAEVGHIRARVCVAGANTVYVDPQIRGLS